MVDPEAALPDSSDLEHLVAGALEALDSGGEAALARFLEPHPQSRDAVLAVVTKFRTVGLLARDTGVELPERLGDFRLLKQIGSGGMGVVFAAEQESLGRTVALKIVRPELLLFDGSRERFRREIEIIVRLDHPAIVPVIATGEHQGVPWYAMPMIVGCSADEVVRRLAGSVPADLTGSDLASAIAGHEVGDDLADTFAGTYWQACVRLARQVALGLHHANHNGVIHRDIKPSNVMLTADGRAMLVDFGLAQVGSGAKLTRTGSAPGSPAYMAPEQLRGFGADARSDVYSLAATLYQLLGLQPPFRATDAELLRTQILQGLSERCPHARLPRDLTRVIGAAMDQDRERRHPDARAFADDLQAVLDRRPIVALRLPLPVRALRWCHRHRSAAALLLVVAGVSVAIPAALSWRNSKAEAELHAEQERTQQSLTQTLTAVREYSLMAVAGDLSLGPGGLETALQSCQRAIEILGGLPAGVRSEDLLRHQTTAEGAYASLLRQAGRVVEAKVHAERVVGMWPDLAITPPAMALVVAQARIDLGRIALAVVQVAAAKDHVAAGEAALRVAANMDQLRPYVGCSRMELAGDLATLRTSEGDPRAAESGLRAALQQIADPGQVLEHRTRSLRGMLRSQLAAALRDQGRGAEATAEFADIRSEFASAITADPLVAQDLLVLAHAEKGLAYAAIGQSDWPASADHLQAAIDAVEVMQAGYAGRFDTLLTLSGLLVEQAQVLGKLERPEDMRQMLVRARDLLHRCIALDPQHVAARHHLGIALEELGKIAFDAGDLDAVQGTTREIAELATGPQQHAAAAWGLLMAGQMASRQNAPERAIALANAALRALLACEASGWFDPVDLGASACDPLHGNAEFEALRARHPTADRRRKR